MNIDVLKKKNVFLFMSSLDITDNDISMLKPVYDLIYKKEKSYTIVWIPIVENWTGDLLKKYVALRSKMPWYSLNIKLFSPIAGIRFIKENWHYKGNPTLVVLNPRGKVEHLNAFHLISVWGLDAFPFNKETELRLEGEKSWLSSIVEPIQPGLRAWVRNCLCIIFKKKF